MALRRDKDVVSHRSAWKVLLLTGERSGVSPRMFRASPRTFRAMRSPPGTAKFSATVLCCLAAYVLGVATPGAAAGFLSDLDNGYPVHYPSKSDEKNLDLGRDYQMTIPLRNPPGTFPPAEGSVSYSTSSVGSSHELSFAAKIIQTNNTFEPPEPASAVGLHRKDLVSVASLGTRELGELRAVSINSRLYLAGMTPDHKSLLYFWLTNVVYQKNDGHEKQYSYNDQFGTDKYNYSVNMTLNYHVARSQEELQRKGYWLPSFERTTEKKRTTTLSKQERELLKNRRIQLEKRLASEEHKNLTRGYIQLQKFRKRYMAHDRSKIIKNIKDHLNGTIFRSKIKVRITKRMPTKTRKKKKGSSGSLQTDSSNEYYSDKYKVKDEINDDFEKELKKFNKKERKQQLTNAKLIEKARKIQEKYDRGQGSTSITGESDIFYNSLELANIDAQRKRTSSQYAAEEGERPVELSDIDFTSNNKRRKKRDLVSNRSNAIQLITEEIKDIDRRQKRELQKNDESKNNTNYDNEKDADNKGKEEEIKDDIVEKGLSYKKIKGMLGEDQSKEDSKNVRKIVKDEKLEKVEVLDEESAESITSSELARLREKYGDGLPPKQIRKKKKKKVATENRELENENEKKAVAKTVKEKEYQNEHIMNVTTQHYSEENVINYKDNVMEADKHLVNKKLSKKLRKRKIQLMNKIAKGRDVNPWNHKGNHSRKAYIKKYGRKEGIERYNREIISLVREKKLANVLERTDNSNRTIQSIIKEMNLKGRRSYDNFLSLYREGLAKTEDEKVRERYLDKKFLARYPKRGKRIDVLNDVGKLNESFINNWPPGFENASFEVYREGKDGYSIYVGKNTSEKPYESSLYKSIIEHESNDLPPKVKQDRREKEMLKNETSSGRSVSLLDTSEDYDQDDSKYFSDISCEPVNDTVKDTVVLGAGIYSNMFPKYNRTRKKKVKERTLELTSLEKRIEHERILAEIDYLEKQLGLEPETRAELNKTKQYKSEKIRGKSPGRRGRKDKPEERRDGDRESSRGRRRDRDNRKEGSIERDRSRGNRDGGYQNRDRGYDNRNRDRGYDNRNRDRGYDNRNRDRGYDNRNRDRGYDNRNRDGGYDNRNRDRGYDNRNRDRGYDNRFRDRGYDNRFRDRGYDNRNRGYDYDKRSRDFGNRGGYNDRYSSSRKNRGGFRDYRGSSNFRGRNDYQPDRFGGGRRFGRRDARGEYNAEHDSRRSYNRQGDRDYNRNYDRPAPRYSNNYRSRADGFSDNKFRSRDRSGSGDRKLNAKEIRKEVRKKEDRKLAKGKKRKHRAKDADLLKNKGKRRIPSNSESKNEKRSVEGSDFP